MQVDSGIPNICSYIFCEQRAGNRSSYKKRVQTEVRTRKYRCPKAYLRIKPPRSSMASQKAPAKRGSLAAMRALVAIQPEGVPVS